jgi:hypothetical protein
MVGLMMKQNFIESNYITNIHSSDKFISFEKWSQLTDDVEDNLDKYNTRTEKIVTINYNN